MFANKYVAVTAKRCSVAPRRCSHSNIIFLKPLKPCEIFAFLLSNLMSFFSNDLILCFLMVSTFVIFFIFNINLLFLQVRAFRSMVIVIPQTGFDCRGSGGLKGWWRFGSRARPPRWRKMLLKPRKNKCLRTNMLLWLLNGARSHHAAAATATLFS